MAGARELTPEVLKEWFYYFYQCTECRRCSVFCPYGIDTAEITMMARELLNLIGVNINWIIEPVANCYRTGNHLGIQPHAFKDNIEFLVRRARGDHRDPRQPVDQPQGRRGPLRRPVGRLLRRRRHLHVHGLPAAASTRSGSTTRSRRYASEGGNFGLFTSHEMMKRLNAKIYAEAKRLGVKWILGGECGHMWRVLHQYMDTMNGPADFLEVPVARSPGRASSNASVDEDGAHLRVHRRPDQATASSSSTRAATTTVRVTFHDSCNPARAMGMLEEPRYIIKKRLQPTSSRCRRTRSASRPSAAAAAPASAPTRTWRCACAAACRAANAVRYVHEKHGVNLLACICAIDRATLSTLMEYWVPEVEVSGVHELVGNALVMEGEKPRTTDLRGEPLARKRGWTPMYDRGKIFAGLAIFLALALVAGVAGGAARGVAPGPSRRS